MSGCFVSTGGDWNAMEELSSLGRPVRQPLLKISESSHALAVHVCGPKETGLRKKRKVFLGRCNDVVLEERVWKWLPEELLDMIFTRLPFAAQSRLQCVCRKWKGMRRLPPASSTIICKAAADGNARFYCESEQRWFSLPSDKYVPEWGTWELVDANGGLVCYRGEENQMSWFWVCNPIRPVFCRLAMPRGTGRKPSQHPHKFKLIVDRATESFQIVAEWTYRTDVYDSRTSRWEPYFDFPKLSTREHFLWDNVVYAYNSEQLGRDLQNIVAALDVKSRRWTYVSTTLPLESLSSKKRLLLSDNKQVMVVLFSYDKRPWPYFSIWKLLGHYVPQPRTAFPEQVEWEKLRIGSERGVVDLTGHSLVGARYNADHVWFILEDDKTKEDGSTAYKFARYSLAAESWSAIPCPGGNLDKDFEMYTWEPSLTIDPR